MNATNSLKSTYDSVVQCNRCGFCTSSCPTYLATGQEPLNPRGRNQTLRLMLEKMLENKTSNDNYTVEAGVENVINSCLMCGACTSVCFSDVPTAHLMAQAKAILSKNSLTKAAINFLAEFFITRPNILTYALKTAFMAKRYGVADILAKIGLLKLISPELYYGNEIIQDVPEQFLQDLKTRSNNSTVIANLHPVIASVAKQSQGSSVSEIATSPLATRNDTILYFGSCGTNFLMPEVGSSTWKALKAMGQNVIWPEHICCGLPFYSNGHLDTAKETARRNIAVFEIYGDRTIIVDDSSCASHLKDYPKLFSGDNDWEKRAIAFARRVKDFSEFIVNLNLALCNHSKTLVTFHDPCKARHGQKIIDEPRQIIQALPGVKLIELPEADQCCGGGGTYALFQPELSRAVMDRKIANITSTGADTVVTTSVSCLIHIKYGIRRNNSKVKLRHLSQILADFVK